MARQVRVELFDDLDGTPAAQTVAFALDGQGYEVDLGRQNAASLRGSLARYVAAARPVPRRGSSVPTRTHAVDARAVRAWAASRHIEVSARGRIPVAVVEQFLAAGN